MELQVGSAVIADIIPHEDLGRYMGYYLISILLGPIVGVRLPVLPPLSCDGYVPVVLFVSIVLFCRLCMSLHM